MEQPRIETKLLHQVNLNTEIQILDFRILNKSANLCTLMLSTEFR